MNPRVAVITPTKNRLRLLCEAMDSVQQQDFDAWEHVIVDDGSDDGTAEEVLRRAALDPRIRYVRRSGEKTGANVCRNLGVNSTSADFVLFLDSDDLLGQHALQQRMQTMERDTELDFAVFPAEVFTERVGDRPDRFDGTTSGDDLNHVLYLNHPWPISGPIWRRASLKALGLFAEELLSWQDVELNVRALVAGLRYAKFEEPDHFIRWHSDAAKTSTQQFQSPDHLKGGLNIVEGFHRRLQAANMLTRTRRRALAGLVFLIAERWTRRGSLSTGLRTWFLAYRAGLAPLTLVCSGSAVLMSCRLGVLKGPYEQRTFDRFKCAVGFTERVDA